MPCNYKAFCVECQEKKRVWLFLPGLSKHLWWFGPMRIAAGKRPPATRFERASRREKKEPDAIDLLRNCSRRLAGPFPAGPRCRHPPRFVQYCRNPAPWATEKGRGNPLAPNSARDLMVSDGVSYYASSLGESQYAHTSLLWLLPPQEGQRQLLGRRLAWALFILSNVDCTPAFTRACTCASSWLCRIR